MPRALMSPVIDACIQIAKATDTPVGDGVAPDCDKPYIVISSVSSPPYTGPLSDGEADSSDRVQFSSIGETREQADLVRDSIRTALTYSALDTEFVTASANRRTLNLRLDVPRPLERDDRGLPSPIFISVDQYLIETTPA